MSGVAETWAEALPEIRKGVTGVGVWTALNTCRPIAIEGGVLVLGVPGQETELAGHLRMPQTRKLIELEFGRRTNQQVELRVIEGTDQEAWERAKRRDAEARRLQDAAMQRARAEVSARTNWDTVYENLSRKYAATPNKSVPMNRAKFYKEAVDYLGQCRKDQAERDDLAERNFARCIERLAQYAEVPSTIVGLDVLQAAGEV
jgi:hypothetical protein